MTDKPEKQPIIIKPLAALVLKSGWYWVPALFWVITAIYGAGFSLKGIGMAAGMAVFWFVTIYATFGTAIVNVIKK